MWNFSKRERITHYENAMWSKRSVALLSMLLSILGVE